MGREEEIIELGRIRITFHGQTGLGMCGGTGTTFGFLTRIEVRGGIGITLHDLTRLGVRGGTA